MSYQRIARTSKPGVSTLTLTPPTGYTWLIQQIAVSSTSAIATVCKILIDGIFVCGSASGNQDSADGNPLPVVTASVVTAQWSNGSAGAVYTLTMFVEERAV